MAYQTPITIKTAIESIEKKQYVLPSIQREFVWGTDQIETLFDSLMRDYPISTFLFWKVEKNRINDFQFYEFLNKYHEKECRHNKKANLKGTEDVIAILDGQQRMTSICIGLTGTFAKKIPYHRWDSTTAFPEKKLYLNLLKQSEELEVEYDFKFLTEEEAKSSEGFFWFECGKILDLDAKKLNKYLIKNKLMDTSKFKEEECDFASDTLFEFFNAIHQKGTISYYLEESEELDKVLQIFIRINSGGTKLSYSDLLLSIATAQWKEKDAREVIHAFVDEVNLIGNGFSFSKDNVLKSCLVLEGFDVKFKSDNFTKENMETIEKDWDAISSAFRLGVQVISKLGYSKDNLLSNNVIVPIAHFLYKNQMSDKILHSNQYKDDLSAIREWLARVSLKGTFSSTTDSIYPGMRTIINDNIGHFPLKEIINHYKGHSKSISFSPDDIETVLDLQYGKPKTYCALTLLYPGLNQNFRYQQDHIHPKTFFEKRKLKKLDLVEQQVTEFIERVNDLSNLQLLEKTENSEKSATSLHEWVETKYSTPAAKGSYLMQNHMDLDESLLFENFLEFYKSRRELLRRELMRILNVTPSKLIETEK
jgi:uncharacterized protein with ParB-like and HNH nuclease domain